jgi:hypothetical protein
LGAPQLRATDLKKARALLKKRRSFKQAPGLIVVAYGGGIDGSLTGEVLRLLEGSAQQLSSFSAANQILRCCAYIAGTTKDTQLANAVIARCLRLVAVETPADTILSLLLIAIKACAAYGQLPAYYTECGNVVSRFAYATSSSAALHVRSILEELCNRDPKFIAALAQPIAFLDATIMGH